MVQVAAVSSQDVADILTSSLEKKGYTVAVRHEPQDKLLHVQIGPFTDKKRSRSHATTWRESSPTGYQRHREMKVAK